MTYMHAVSANYQRRIPMRKTLTLFLMHTSQKLGADNRSDAENWIQKNTLR